MIPAGTLDRRLTIYASTSSRSTTGVEKATWSAVATVWAARKSLSLADASRMAGRDDSAEAKFIIRYRDGLNTSAQIECEGRRYVVLSVDDLGRRDCLALLVRAI